MPDDDSIPLELSEKILAYVERQVGRNVELSPEDEAMVRELLLKNPNARALADEFCDVDTALKAMFKALGSIPVSEQLMKRIQEQQDAFDARQSKAEPSKDNRDKS